MEKGADDEVFFPLKIAFALSIGMIHLLYHKTMGGRKARYQ
jgi:hypothetical protein